jgi:hypothetical protein
LYISVIFPVADFRSFHREAAGRLEKPRWGESDPQAEFARGFGSIHVRTKSGGGFVGENYYADCENLLKYPSLLFVNNVIGYQRDILLYPIHRRFYFDGKMAGRFEFGFRLNEPTIYEIQMLASARGKSINYDPLAVIAQLLLKNVEIEVLDGREVHTSFFNASTGLRDSYLLSSTRHSKLNQYDISSVGTTYVSVGQPYVFLRAGFQTPLKYPKRIRLLHSGKFEMFVATSGVQGKSVDSIIIESKHSLDGETEKERIARLIYVQMRALSFAHSFYVRQVDSGKFVGESPLTPALHSMLERLRSLSPLEGDGYDAEVCAAMAEVIRNSNVKPEQLAAEVTQRFKKNWVRRLLSPVFRIIDRKSDIAIEAAASTATKYVLTGSP